jgi:hypothetical protein
MRFNIFRSRALNLGAGVSALVAVALLACFFLPLHRPAQPAGSQLRISTPPGSAERIAKVEKDLQALQAEAAKDPARPTVAEIRSQLDRMVKEKKAP